MECRIRSNGRQLRLKLPSRLAMLALVLVLGAGWRGVHAQQPARLPAVVVNVAPDPPGPRKIAGVVRDTLAIPIDSAEVSIVSLSLRIYSKGDGNFRFENVKPGKYDVRVRKLGYAPQVKTMVVDSTGATDAFALVPLPHVMRPVVTTVSRGGLSGVVGDTSFNALVGVDIRVMGHAEYTTTDSTGSFHIPIRPGSYILSIRHPGFNYRLVSAIVPPDSGQRVTVNLAPLSKLPMIRQVHNVDDFASRLEWHERKNSRIYTRADLQQMKIEWVYDAVLIGYHEMHVGPPGWLDKDCAAVINGGPEFREMNDLTVDDIESVEIYDRRSGPSYAPRGRPSPPRVGVRSPRVQLAIDPVPLTNTDRADHSNSTKTCTLVYVWLR
jgi:protocatechuate 3,4-dioxygenase beta subunit